MLLSLQTTNPPESCVHFRTNCVGNLSKSISGYEPTPVEYVAVDDQFGESGTPAELMKEFGLDTEHIIKAVERVIAR